MWFSNPLGGGRPGEGGHPTADDGTTAGSSQQQGQRRPNPREDQEQQDETTETARRQRHAEDMRRLQALSTRDVINGTTLAEAEEALQSDDNYRVRAARLLASERISQDDFGAALEAFEDGNNSEKALARGFVTGRFDANVFHDALVDLDGGDRFESALARRLALRQIDEEEYRCARTGLLDPDVDIVRASQMLALHGDPVRFRQEINMTPRQRNQNEQRAEDQQILSPIEDQRQRTHDQIVEVLLQANVFIEELPEQERTRPLLRMRTNLQRLNDRDNQNRTALSGLLRKINEEEEHLSQQDVNYIWNFTPQTKDEFTAFKERLEEMDLTAGQTKNIMRLKMEEWDIETHFLNEVKVFDQVMKAVGSQINQQRRVQRMIEEASEASGVNLKCGTKIQYIHPDPATDNVRTVTIRDIEAVRAPIFGRNQEILGDQPIGLRIHLDSGETYSLSRFLKWVDAADVHEVIRDQTELDAALGLPQLGMTLQSGQKLEYDTGYHVDPKNGAVVPERGTVNVVSVNENGVELAEPVVTLRPEQAPQLGLTAPRMSREMNLGEFAKWARRNNAMPNVPNLQELRQHLSGLINYRNQTMSRNPASFPPIRVEPGEFLRLGDSENRPMIKETTDDEITFADGAKMTLPAFLVWAKNNNVESGDPEIEAERVADSAANLGEPREQAKKSALRKFFEGGDKKDGGGNGGGDRPSDKAKGKFLQSLAEKISPYMPQKASPVGYLGEVWSQTTFLSIMDLYNMGKEIIEFIKRKHHRKSKNRFSGLGGNLPFQLNTEMNRIQQAAENEEVNTYKEAMDQWGTWQVLEKLHTTHSKDEAKACFFVLTEKGEIRWDDMAMWNTLNYLTSNFTNQGAKLFIPLTKEPQPHPVTGVPTSGEDRTKDAIDAMWGEGNWAGWFSKNISTYNSSKSAYEFKGKQLEHDPKGTGGLAGELTRLLAAWKNGEYVCPHEYEELIDFGIKYGKMKAEQKMFFLMEGITATCPSGPMKGMTLLHLDRIGELDGVYLNQFPMLDFFTNKDKKVMHPKYISGELDEPPMGGYKPEDFRAFRDKYFAEESKKCEVGKDFSRFLWEWMIVDPNFRKRLSKGLRRAENMDHDDAHLFIPPATMEEIESFTGSLQGSQKFFTMEGYKNGYPGYNQYIVSLSNRYEDLSDMKNKGLRIDDEALEKVQEQMLSALQGYFLFDAFMDGRKDQTNDRRARLDKLHYNDKPVVDSSATVSQHKIQLDNLILEICREYGIDPSQYMLYEHAEWSDRQGQSKIANNLDIFLKRILPKAFEDDKGRKVFEIVARKKNDAINNAEDPNALRGIKNSNRLLQGE